MKRTIAVFTGSRAEYGLLFWLLKEIQASPELDLRLVVSGMHLSSEFGETWREIEADGFPIAAKVEMLVSSNTPVGVAKSLGLGTIGLADALSCLRPDALVLLGDRFEALAAAQTALLLRIPIVHLHGGEISEGAYDDAIRHAITKMAALHCVAAEPYRKRVVQMGEAPDRVFHVGALGLDHILRTERFSVQELAASLDFPLRQPFFLLTYHPVTALDEDPALAMREILDSLEQFPDHQVIMTYPNADNGGRDLIPMLEAHAQKWPDRALLVPSLGFKRYLSAVASADAVLGNSSSGIIEAPSLHTPVVNIGLRQQGRLAALSVLHCPAKQANITSCLHQALSPEHRDLTARAVNPYGQGNAAQAVRRILETADLNKPKTFFPIDHAF